MLAGNLITTLTAYYLPSFFKDGATVIANGASLFFFAMAVLNEAENVAAERELKRLAIAADIFRRI